MRARGLRAAGHDAVMLGAGEPDFITPDVIIDAAFEAARGGATRYTPMRGTVELCDAIRRKLELDHGLSYGAQEVMASTGAKQALHNAMQAILDPGDEVIVPTPCWVSYGDIASLAGATAVHAATTYEGHYLLDPQVLEQAISPRTRLIVFNSPNNPTGARYDAPDWRALGEVLARYPKIFVLCDDIYEKILLDDMPFVHFLQACPELKNRTVVVNGVSTAYAMTGWRLGYAAGPRDIIAGMEVIQSQATSCPSAVSQAAAAAALGTGDELLMGMRSAFRERHDHVHESMLRLPGIRCHRAAGAFYLFPDFSEINRQFARLGVVDSDDDAVVAEYLLIEHGVGLVPGSAFMGAGCMRLSFATSMERLNTALERLTRALKVLQP